MEGEKLTKSQLEMLKIAAEEYGEGKALNDDPESFITFGKLNQCISEPKLKQLLRRYHSEAKLN